MHCDIILQTRYVLGDVCVAYNYTVVLPETAPETFVNFLS